MADIPLSPPPTRPTAHEIVLPLGLGGFLSTPREPEGIVVFAHGSGSSRFSPRNTHVVKGLNAGGLATLLFDLLREDEAASRANVFDIELLAGRLLLAVGWLRDQPVFQTAGVGLFGSSTGAAGALIAAAKDSRVAAVVSRGGRPDLALTALPNVTAPTLLIVGERDTAVLDLNRQAFDRLACEKQFRIVPGATHLFEEPGTLDLVIDHAREWFVSHLGAARQPGA